MVGKGRLDKNGRRLLKHQSTRNRTADALSDFLSIGDAGEKSSGTQREPIAGLPELTDVSDKVERVITDKPECKKKFLLRIRQPILRRNLLPLR